MRRKGLAPVFVAREKGKTDELWRASQTRVSPESFYTNSWPESDEIRQTFVFFFQYHKFDVTDINMGMMLQICNAVLAARIMNATLVLPELDANSFWHDDSGFQGIYDVEHFIETLKYDVKIVGKIPDVHKNGKTKKIKAFQIRPPRDAPIDWYLTTALKAMKEHSAIYLTPFSHRLAEEIDNPEYQRLRCRVNYHALRFKPHIMKLSESIVDKLRSQGHFMSIHLRFEMDMLAFAGCFDIFNPEEQKILKKYRKENFAEKRLIYNERRAIGKCPLTPEEVGLILRAMRFDNSTRIYLAAGELFGGDRFMKPFRTLFPRLDNHSSVDPSSEELSPTYDGPSNFANNLFGHRLYYGFRTTIRPNRKGLAPVFVAREKGKTGGFEEAVRRVMMKTNFGGPHRRVRAGDKYPPDSVLASRLESVGDSDSASQTDSTVVGLGR
ncbi:hypothetical protein Bca52824_079623 [Brassica carinata]|uniref:O-fucosyltransferase family protein n=1 Tax=Brassica carinata TaxID=52824 RepID=A0A8X7PXS9_BRACI|nr:hypothetical protein Bca52824_079623 [Brassica carinata]